MSPSRLDAGQSLTVNESLVSDNGRFTLILQEDGNLVLYGPGHTSMWASGTAGDFIVQQAQMQADGNFVIYDNRNKSVWASGSNKTGMLNPFLLLQDDGNLVIYATTSFWATNTVT